MMTDLRTKIQTLLDKQQYEEAIPLIRNMCTSQPEDPESYYLLGCAQARLGRLNEAGASLKHCISLAPNIALPHFALSGVLISQGLITDAVNSLRRSIEINDSLIDAHIALADLLINSQDFTNARAHLNTALKLNPEKSEAYFGLARIEQETENHEVAIKYLEKALRYKPDFTQALCAMGNSTISIARVTNKCSIQDALPYFKKALEISPDSIEALADLAILYEFTGEFEDAFNLIKPIVGSTPPRATVALAYVRLCTKLGLCDSAIEYTNKVLTDAKLSPKARKTLEFELAKVYDKMSRYDEAFFHYETANQVQGPQTYDTVGNANNTKLTISIFNPGLFMRIPPSKVRDKRPVFIVGMPRSGTTLTEQILASHSQVFAAGELTTLGGIVDRLPNQLNIPDRYPSCVELLNQELVEESARQYLSHITSLAGTDNNILRITDKNPYNFYFLGLIQILFPDAHVIHCMRDPLDTCLSLYFQDFNEKHDYARDLTLIGTRYNQYKSLMSHWENLLTLPIHQVHYEDLINDHEATTRNLISFCGLEWDDNCLEFYKLDRTINTPSYDQVRQPIYNSSVGRWRNYEKYLAPLLEGLNREY